MRTSRVYTHELAETGSDWGIRGIGLLRQDVRMAEALAPQDHLYTLVERGNGEPHPRIVGSIIDYRLAHEQLADAVDLAADPAVAILSLTITEAGYGDRAGGATSSTPTTFDVIAMGLDRRRQAGHAPLTIVSCDNLPGNGDVARRSTLVAARRVDASLADWADRHCAFPNSMVDRITPATSDADRAWLLDAVGVMDRWPVVAEPFRQWVIEDEFANGRPRWEDVGVLFTDRVHDWELYKLRLLNAGHSSMAYLAALAGVTYVDEAMALPEVRHFLHHLLIDEAVPSLAPIPGHPRARLRRLGARTLRQHRRPRPDRPPVHRRQLEVPYLPAPDSCVPARQRRTDRPQRAGAGRLGPVPGRRSGGPAGVRRGRRHGAAVRPEGDGRPDPLPRLRGGVPASGGRQRPVPRQLRRRVATRR